MLPIVLPVVVVLAVAAGVATLGEIFLLSDRIGGHNAALPVGLAVMVIVTAGSFFYGGGLSGNAPQHTQEEGRGRGRH